MFHLWEDTVTSLWWGYNIFIPSHNLNIRHTTTVPPRQEVFPPVNIIFEISNMIFLDNPGNRFALHLEETFLADYINLPVNLYSMTGFT